jgi:hypothetical protein
MKLIAEAYRTVTGVRLPRYRQVGVAFSAPAQLRLLNDIDHFANFSPVTAGLEVCTGDGSPDYDSCCRSVVAQAERSRILLQIACKSPSMLRYSVNLLRRGHTRNCILLYTCQQRTNSMYVVPLKEGG